MHVTDTPSELRLINWLTAHNKTKHNIISRRKINMIMSNQKRMEEILLGASDACTREKVSFSIRFEDSVRVGRSETMREGIPKRMSKTTRGKSNVDTWLGDEIEGGRVNKNRKDDNYRGPALWSERWTRVANLKLIRC